MRKSEYPTDTSTLGRSFRKKRLDLDKSLAEISSNAGITESYLSRIEADLKVPSIKLAVTIAKILDIDDIEIMNFIIKKTFPEAKIVKVPQKFLPKTKI